MMWLFLLSDFVPDFLKSEKWKLWDRKSFWIACRGVYGRNYEKAYRCLKAHENTRLFLLECYKVTK